MCYPKAWYGQKVPHRLQVSKKIAQQNVSSTVGKTFKSQFQSVQMKNNKTFVSFASVVCYSLCRQRVLLSCLYSHERTRTSDQNQVSQNRAIKTFCRLSRPSNLWVVLIKCKRTDAFSCRVLSVECSVLADFLFAVYMHLKQEQFNCIVFLFPLCCSLVTE